MTTTELTARDEHQRAHRKHAAWQEEIDQWRAEHRRALETLEQATLFVQEHDALLDHHSEAIVEHEKALEAHEAAIAAERDEPASKMTEHDRLEEIHQNVLEQHNRFRGRHPALMQEMARLAVELHKVSHQPG